MAAALALAVALVVVVALLSLAVNSQGQFAGGERGTSVGTEGPSKPSPRALRRPQRERGERPKRERRPSAPEVPSEPAPGPEQVFGDLRPLNRQAPAVVLSIVDERTVGPVTRCRLTLRVQPSEGEAFEVTTRVAFPTPEERAKVKVGVTLPVRYDSEDHRRVAVETDKPAGG